MRKYFVTITFLLLLAASVYVFFSPADIKSIQEENREPAKLPHVSSETLISGEFASGFDSYVNDNIGYRGSLTSLSDDLKSYFGFTPRLVGKVISSTSDIGTEETLETSLMLLNGRVMEMFSKKPEVEAEYAKALNNIASILPENVKMYSMLVPTQLEFAQPIYRNAQDSQQQCIEDINSQLSASIVPIDVYGKLKTAEDARDDGSDDNLYFKMDHHWTMDGAYCGYEAFMDKTGAQILPKDDFELKEGEDFYGTLYLKAKSDMEEPEPEKLYYYDVESVGNFDVVMRVVYDDGTEKEYGENAPIFDSTKEGYLFFLGGDQPVIEITNNNKKDGKTLMIIKDSYANALVPWLINNYQKVVLIDPRSFKGTLQKEFERYQPDELAVVNYVFTTTFSDYCTLLNRIATK